MFGTGLYFAPKAKKSVGYTDSGFWAKRTGSANYSNSTVLLLAFKGTSLRNDECIVYNDDACTLSYIIELAS